MPLRAEGRQKKKRMRDVPCGRGLMPGGVWRRLGRVEVRARPNCSAVGVAGSVLNRSSAVHGAGRRAELSQICQETQTIGRMFHFYSSAERLQMLINRSRLGSCPLDHFVSRSAWVSFYSPDIYVDSFSHEAEKQMFQHPANESSHLFDFLGKYASSFFFECD